MISTAHNGDSLRLFMLLLYPRTTSYKPLDKNKNAHKG